MLVLPVEVVLGPMARALEALRRKALWHATPEMDAALPQRHEPGFSPLRTDDERNPGRLTELASVGVADERHHVRLGGGYEDRGDGAIGLNGCCTEFVKVPCDGPVSESLADLRPQKGQDRSTE